MKTSAILAAAAAAATARAAGPSDQSAMNCAKPNASYCVASDIILRCDAHGVGTPGRCSDNVSGYPPMGGIADCYESSRDAGDAACQKNCVVYAQPSFTLPADKCTPSYTATSSGSAIETGIMSIPEGTSLGTATNIASIPEGTSLGTATTPSTLTPSANGTASVPTASDTGKSSGGGASSNPGTRPTTTTGQSVVPTAGAPATRAAGVLAAAALVAAYLI